MTAKYPHPEPCACKACRVYGERLELVLALNNPVPKALSDTINRQFRRYTILSEADRAYRSANAGVRQ